MKGHDYRVRSGTAADETVWTADSSRPKDRTRVLFVSEDLGVGGLERVVATLCRELDPNEFEAGVLCLREVLEFGEDLLEEGFPIFLLPHEPNKPDYLAFRHIARVLRQNQIDVVHTHNTGPFFAGGIGALLAGTPRLIHTDHARDFPDKLRYAIAENLLSRISTRVVGCSTHTTENLVRYEKIPRRKLMTIPNGITPPAMTPSQDLTRLRQELSLPEGQHVIGLGCRHSAQKNLAMMIDAFAILRRSRDDITLLLCGNGEQHSDLQAHAARLGLSEHVRFPGMRTDMLDVLKLIDVYLMTSVWEGLPMAVLEAMALGLPIVSTRVGGVSDAIRHEQSGLLVESGDTQAFATSVARVLDDAELRKRLSENASALFHAEFSASAMTRRYEALYRGDPAA